MAKHLTARAVELAKPLPGRRQEIPDGVVAGLYLIVQPTGAKSWALRYRNAEGKSRKLTLSYVGRIDDLVSARNAARAALDQLAAGRDPATEKRRQREEPDDAPVTVRDVFDSFLTRHAKKKQRAWRETERVFLKDVLPVLGDKPIADLRKRHLLDLLDEIADRPAPALASRVYDHLRKFLRWAVGREFITVSPLAGVDAPEKPAARERVLTEDEIRAFLWAIRRQGLAFRTISLLLLYTGQRRSEVAEMGIGEVAHNQALWVLPADRVKNKQEHYVHLAETPLSLFTGAQALRRPESSFVFPSERSDKKAFSGFGRCKNRLDADMLLFLRKQAERAGGDPEQIALPDWRLHDLRRTTVSGMAALGTPVHIAERVINHISGTFRGITSVYQRYEFNAEREKALTDWAEYLDRLNDEIQNCHFD